MRTILFLLRKEFTQIFRDKFMRVVIFLMPIIQLIILIPAVTFEIKSIKLGVIDNDKSTLSKEFYNNFAGSDFFKVKYLADELEGDKYIENDKIDLYIILPNNFERSFYKEKDVHIDVVINALNGSFAQLALGYTQGIIAGINGKQIQSNINYYNSQPKSMINIENRFWYNPDLNYKIYMVPGVLAILVTAIGLLLSGLNLVKEKEVGTIEQINVTPIKKYQFITAKLLPFLLIGIVDFFLGIIVSIFLYDLPFEGSIFTQLLTTFLYLFSILGIGLFFSTIASSQQQYLFVVFFIMMIIVLMCGVFTPTSSMPLWAQYIDLLNPAYYFVKMNRMVILKGSGIMDLWREILSLTVLGIAFLSAAILKYKKTV